MEYYHGVSLLQSTMSAIKHTNLDTGRPKHSRRKKTRDNAADNSDDNKEWDRNVFQVCVVYGHDDDSEFEPSKCIDKLLCISDNKYW